MSQRFDINQQAPKSGRMIKEDNTLINEADLLGGSVIDEGGGNYRWKVQVDVDTVTATNVTITNFPTEYALPAAQITALQSVNAAQDGSWSVSVDNLPTDYATAAKQLPDNHQVTVSNQITQPTTPADTQPVSAASLPLPTGAATAANQLPDNHQVTVSNQINQPIEDGGAVEVHSEYLFSSYQASLADGAEIDSGWLDMSTVDKYQFEGLASATGMTQVIESSSGPAGTGAVVTTTTPIVGTFQLFNVIARQRYMRFRWQNNTGSPVTDAALSIKASYGSSDKLSVLSLNTTPSDFSQSILTQSVLFGLNEVTTQREQVSLSGNNNLIVALGDRISQTGGRSHFELNLENVTAGTKYTIPSGQRLHVTSVEFAGANTTNTAPLRVRLRDGGIGGQMKYSFAINEATTFTQQAGYGCCSYPEPTVFETNIHVQIVSGVYAGDILIVGYLEPI